MSLTVDEILNGMNDEQKKAVKHTEGPLLVMAGAGSGKTRVLTHRIAYLLAEKEVPPYNILAITFTNKAAKEMKSRIVNLVGEQADEMIISTFHSLCVRILRRDGDRIGIDRNFVIYDSSDQLTAMKEALRIHKLDPKQHDPRSLLYKISHAKNDLVTPKELIEKAEASGDFFEQIVAKVYDTYETILRKNQALDFDSLIMETYFLFERVPDVLHYYQNRFQYIHVDEYQDTNHAQYKLVKLLAKRFQNICVVGDSDQSIYRWRGADINNILSFEEDYPQARVILLEQNYRSTKNILEAANQVIENNRSRKPKKLWSDNDEGLKLTLYQAYDEQEEARYIAKQVQQLSDTEGYNYRDFAILYRTNAQSRAMEDVLVKSNIPYRMIGGQKFYERMEIKDLLSYLRLITNPHDDVSFVRVVNVPKRGIGATSLLKLQEHAEMNDLSLFDAVEVADFAGISKKAVNSLHEFRALIEQWQKQDEFLNVTELVEEVLKHSGYEEALTNERTLEAQTRLENLEEFKTVSRQYDEENEGNDESRLIDFLTELALVSDADEGDDLDNRVTLMTLHSAKGLEFPIVFLIGMEENLFPHSRSLIDDDELEEERRLAYVGITRAEERLFLTHASTRFFYGSRQSNFPSRFLNEIDDDLIEKESAFNDSVDMNDVRLDNFETSGLFERKPKRKATVIQTRERNDESWSVGDKVNHKKWGEGVVVKVVGSGDDTELDIAFPAPVGIKRLLAQFAPITKTN